MNATYDVLSPWAETDQIRLSGIHPRNCAAKCPACSPEGDHAGTLACYRVPESHS